LASLWAMIWRDEAGPPAACARVRAAAGQERPKRLELGFDADPGVIVASKGGTIPGVINNDIGVVTFPDGRRYAAGVYTRAQTAFAGEQARPAHHRRPRRDGDTQLATQLTSREGEADCGRPGVLGPTRLGLTRSARHTLGDGVGPSLGRAADDQGMPASR
jgi:Beta-lactamase enzyme family